MLGDELEDLDQLEADATPSYLLPATPADVIGGKVADKEDEFGLPSAPLANN